MLRFLVDESTGRKVFAALTQEGHDAVFVADKMPSAKDKDVLRFAAQSQRILITNDKDFGELIFRLQKPSNGVILLRLSIDTPHNRINAILTVIKMYKAELHRHLIVVSEEKVRLRRLI